MEVPLLAFLLGHLPIIIRNEEGQECYWHQSYKKTCNDANDVHHTFNFYCPLPEVENFQLLIFKNYMQGSVILLNIIPLL